MANSFYDHTTYPSTSSSLSSSALRSELDLIEQGFDKLPTLSGNGSKIIAVNSGASALEAITTTGTGSGVRATSPTLTTPTIGVATATSINGLTIASSTGTLSITNGKTFACTGTLTLAGTDGSTLNVGTGGTLGTAAYGTLGTSANNVVQLTAAAKLPAVDGSLLTNLVTSGATYLKKTGTYTAVANDAILASTTGGAWTLTLPASPAQFDKVGPIVDSDGTWQTNNLTIGRNGSNIMGIAENMVCSQRYGSFSLEYDSATPGWRIF